MSAFRAAFKYFHKKKYKILLTISNRCGGLVLTVFAKGYGEMASVMIILYEKKKVKFRWE